MSSRQLVSEPSLNDEIIAKRLFEAKIPLLMVVTMKNSEVTRLMIEYGSEVNQIYFPTGFTPLHVAVQQSSLDNVKVLIEHGADVNNRGQCGYTPICGYDYAEYHPDNFEIMKLLLDSGASVTIRDFHGFMPLEYILDEYTGFKVLDILLKYDINFNAQDCRGWTPLHQILSKDVRIFKYQLKDREINPHLKDNLGQTALVFAVQYERLNIVELLLERGANVNSKCNDGITPLFHAFRKKVPKYLREEISEIVDTLLENGADVQVVSLDGETVIDYAVKTKNYALLKPIIGHLVLQKFLGTPIKEIIQTKIDRNPKISQVFAKYNRLMEIMVKGHIYGSVTPFKLLTASHDKLTKYLRNQTLVERIYKLDDETRYDTYYFRVLREKVFKAHERAEFQEKAAVVISHIASMPDLVIDKIIDYLDEDSLEQMCKVYDD